MMVQKAVILMSGPNYEFEKKSLRTSDFKTPVTFFAQGGNDSPEPDSSGKIEVFSCFCHAYSPSNKDLTVLDAHGVKRGITIDIPASHGEFIADNSMTAIISDFRYVKDGQYIEWNVIDPRLDIEDNFADKIVLGVSE